MTTSNSISIYTTLTDVTHPACRRREARPGFRMERENTTKAKVATMAAIARNTNFRLAGEAVDPSLPGLQSTVTERGSLGRKKTSVSPLIHLLISATAIGVFQDTSETLVSGAWLHL